MAAWDNLGPQFQNAAPFDTTGDVYGGSAYQYSRVNRQSGEEVRNSRKSANMQGRFFAGNVEDGLSSGNTTDRSTKGMAMDVDKAPLQNFKPNAHGNQSGAWN